MKSNCFHVLWVCSGVAWCGAASAQTVGTAFTYQGELVDGSTPVTTPCDFVFTLHDAESGGNQIGGPLNRDTITLMNGVFSVTIDFGENLFEGNARWLGIAVLCPSGSLGPSVELSPRQEIRPVPYALALPAMRVEQNRDPDPSECPSGTLVRRSPNVIGGWYGNTVAEGVQGATIAGGGGVECIGTPLTALLNTVTASFASVGGGSRNVAGGEHATVSGGEMNQAGGRWATVGGGKQNIARGEESTVSGGFSNEASGCGAICGGSGNMASGDAFVGGGIGNHAMSSSVVGGGFRNSAENQRATIGGGSQNRATGAQSAIGGGNNNETIGTVSTIGGGEFNLASGARSVVCGGDSNIAHRSFSFVGGGLSNEADGEYATVSGGRENSSASSDASVGGGFDNRATGGSSTVAGGAHNWAIGTLSFIGGGEHNNASTLHASIGGGEENVANGNASTVGGGRFNRAGGRGSAVGGGLFNEANGASATVCGGDNNFTLRAYTSVGGGRNNEVRGTYGTIPGGANNNAGGNYSFAAGRRAKVREAGELSAGMSGDDDGDEGTFIWADSTDADFISFAPNQFRVRATGGTHFVSAVDVNGEPTTGVELAPGTSAWAPLSDRELKENIKPVDARHVLNRLASLPIATWNWKAESGSVRHMGPMAQDFHAAFGLGADEKRIVTVDSDGVALAAIQGLHQLVKEKDARIADLTARLERMEATVAKLVATTD